MTETWQAVSGYEGMYEVSDLGKVRSLDRTTFRMGRNDSIKGRILRPTTLKYGHQMVRLSRQGTTQKMKVHRLVAKAFVPGEAAGLEVCHNDGVASNNAATNLRWDTHLNNARDALKHGTQWQARKTHCPSGHLYNEENTYAYRRGRQCKACRRISSLNVVIANRAKRQEQRKSA